MTNSETTPANDLPFEAALAELQELVRTLEEGTLGLDDSIARFERGISLLRRCYEALDRAEQRIELLTGFDSNGNPTTTAFDASASHDPSGGALGKRQNAQKKRSKPEPDSAQNGSIFEEEDRESPLF